MKRTESEREKLRADMLTGLMNAAAEIEVNKAWDYMRPELAELAAKVGRAVNHTHRLIFAWTDGSTLRISGRLRGFDASVELGLSLDDIYEYIEQEQSAEWDTDLPSPALFMDGEELLCYDLEDEQLHILTWQASGARGQTPAPALSSETRH